MTLDEAKKVAKVLEGADGGCNVCVRDLAEEMAGVFPKFLWEFDEDTDSINVRFAKSGS